MDSKQLVELCRMDRGTSPEAIGLARSIATNLNTLKDVISKALVDRVVEDFMDAGTPLKHFTDCVVNPASDEKARDSAFEDKAMGLAKFTEKGVHTAKMVAVGTATGNKKLSESLFSLSEQVREGGTASYIQK